MGAARLGADFIGLNVWASSPRHITVDEAVVFSEVLRRLDAPPRVALVVVLPDVGDLREIVRRIRPDDVQVHGAWGDEVEVEGARVIRGFGLSEERDLAAIDSWPGDLVIVDAKVEGMHGGTGRRVPAELVARMRRRCLLAGGLTPENVGEAVRRFRPWAVDVASGVESSPGVKDLGLVKAFLDAVRTEDALGDVT